MTFAASPFPTSALEAVLVFVVLTDLTLLGSNRTHFSIRAIALQGLGVGLMPLLLCKPDPAAVAHAAALSAASVGLKAVLFPRLLWRALRDTQVREEPAPLVGYSLSMVLGVGLLALAFWLARRLDPPVEQPTRLLLPAALFTLLGGLFLICARNRALTQVLGYLLLDNGIYLFGLAVALESPFLIEIGALLDVFLAVLVMGVALFHINRAFDSIDVDRLAELKD
jgi:hydrogenase-4 component E